jgi:hypothetical protein
LNGVLLVEIDCGNAGGIAGAGDDMFNFDTGSDSSEISGLAINSFGLGQTPTGSADPSAIIIGADDVKIYGNYIGTDPLGLVEKANIGCGICSSGGSGLRVGGLTPEKRNIISGNKQTGISPNTGSNDWTIQGNFIGVDATGLAAIPNSDPVTGGGSISLDNGDNHVVGGLEAGSINVMGGSFSHGIAPHNVDNMIIEGNYVGLGYDGTTVLGNTSNGGDGAGITLSDITNSTIKDNHIAGWSKGGIDVNQGNNNILIESNVVHDNAMDGMELSSQNVTAKNNVIYDNGSSNINITAYSAFGLPADGIKVVGNKIGVQPDGELAPNNNIGVLVMGDPANVIIGGTDLADANTISANNAAGITINSFTAEAIGMTISPIGVSILGNSILGNSPGTVGLFTGDGIGIDLAAGIDSDSPPDGSPNSSTNLGPTPNDPSDSDTGPNHFINFPVLNSVEQNGSTASIDFNLDAADGENDQYRVEFFSNDTPDPSGYGEGQTFLGSTTVTNGNNQLATLTLPSGTNLANKAVSATTTAIDSNATSGFGSTSEFSRIVTATSTTQTRSDQASSSQNTLAKTGENSSTPLIVSTVLLSCGLGLSVDFRRRQKI